jgi:DNA-binding NarL/FixJ family response regulator
VRKHLENIYSRLEITNRTATITRIFPDAASP